MPKTIQAVEQAAELKLYLPQLDKLEERMLEWKEQDLFQAMVLKATRYGVPIFEGCYGASTNDSGVGTDTIFPVASNTKPVIAALIMILLEDGRLELEDPIWKFQYGYYGNGWEKIQLWHFLTHTSGINDDEIHKLVDDYIEKEFGIERPGENSTGEDWDLYNSKLKQTLESLDDDFGGFKGSNWEKVALKIELKTPPRTVMSYCNYGYNKLKEVICDVTGESIDSYARRVLFEPLGMVDSHWVLPKEKWGRVLGRDERSPGHGWLNSEGCYTRESGAGGLKTTPNDMSNFCEMILGQGRYKGQRILSPASVREMTSNYNSDFSNPWDAWALGWNYRGTKVDDSGVLRSARSVQHGGWGGHVFMIDPEYGLSIILYTAPYPGFRSWSIPNNMVIAACE